MLSDRHGMSSPPILLLLWGVSKWYLVFWFVWRFQYCCGGFLCPLHPTSKCCCGVFLLHRTVFTSQYVEVIVGWVSRASSRASGLSCEWWYVTGVLSYSALHRFSLWGRWDFVTLISHPYWWIFLYLCYIVLFDCLLSDSGICLLCSLHQQNLLSQDTSSDFNIGGRPLFLLALYSTSYGIYFQGSHFVTLISLRYQRNVLCLCYVGCFQENVLISLLCSVHQANFASEDCVRIWFHQAMVLICYVICTKQTYFVRNI